MKTIDQWSVREDPLKPYVAPEQQPFRKYVSGVLEEDGRPITTSHIRQADGRLVTTRSGSVYRLGEIDPGYLAWMQENGIAHDPENPIRLVAPQNPRPACANSLHIATEPGYAESAQADRRDP